MPNRQSKHPVSNTYKSLVHKISQELSDLEAFLKRRAAEGYWKVGKYIDEHLLTHKERANYGATLFTRLAKDAGCDKSTLLRALQFYRTYPIVADQRQLSWDHYKRLITIKDEKERKKIEKTAIRNEWSTTKLGKYLSIKRELASPKKAGTGDKGAPIPQLKFERGTLYTYKIIEPSSLQPVEGYKVVDCGFETWRQVATAQLAKFNDGEIVETVKTENGYKIKSTGRTAKDLYTFKATVERVIDADTLLVHVDCGFETWTRQRLRFRGIDAPEISTPEGQRAKRFIESRIKPNDFVVIKTYKSDKFDRYLVDVFYAPQFPQNGKTASTPRPPKEGAGASSEWDPAKVAAEGVYLNQELLNEHLAVAW